MSNNRVSNFGLTLLGFVFLGFIFLQTFLGWWAASWRTELSQFAHWLVEPKTIVLVPVLITIVVLSHDKVSRQLPRVKIVTDLLNRWILYALHFWYVTAPVFALLTLFGLFHTLAGLLAFIITLLARFAPANRRQLIRSRPTASVLVDVDPIRGVRNDGSKLEQLTVDLIIRDGGAASRTGGSGDGGVDVIGTAANGRRIIAQCKQYAPDATITPAAVRELIGAAHLVGVNQDPAILFVTTASAFSAQARSEAHQGNVVLIGRDRLHTWMSGDHLVELGAPQQVKSSHVSIPTIRKMVKFAMNGSSEAGGRRWN